MAVRRWLLANRSLENWCTDCVIKLALILKVYRLMMEGHFLYCQGARAIMKKNRSASSYSPKFPGSSHDIKIEATIVPINASKG